jgi:D-lactate dehydrogenase (cytochrome)
VLFGHLGQFHLHLNFLPEDEDELARAKELYRDLARFAVKLGGTISAEHGVGKKRLDAEDGDDHPYLWYMYGDEGLSTISQVKLVFDPNWILNPHTMVPAK